MDRINFITHKGQRMMHLDFSNTKTEEFIQVCEATKPLVKKEPLKSLRFLVDVTDADLNAETKDAVKALAAHNIEHSIATAVIGVTGFKAVIMNSVIMFTKSNMKSFDTHEQGKDWLITQS